MASRFIIGIDEVGRGSLAGPVAVCVTLIPKGLKLRGIKNMPKLRDSKKMTEKNRKIWVNYARSDGRITHKIVFAGEAAVDVFNVSKAANLAAEHALELLIRENGVLSADIFLDAGLLVRAPEGFSVRNIVRGDDKIPAISLAAVLAKTARDTYMRLLHFAYPNYGFWQNVGYGTKEHLTALKLRGLSRVHRENFCRLYRT